MIEASELNDKSFAQLKFLDECITTIESLKNNTDTVRTFYLKESARFVEVEIEMKKVKLNNNFLLKLLSKLIPKPKQD